MPRERAPGVYFEPADPPQRGVTEVRTDIAGFVGVAERGPLHVPVKVESWTQFVTRFGEAVPQGLLAYAVRGFFSNEGRTCWVVRVGADQGSSRAKLQLLNRAGEPVFLVEARDPGPGGERISVRVEQATAGRFSLSLRIGPEILEVWRDLSPIPKGPDGSRQDRYAELLINGLSSQEPGMPQFEESTHPGSVLIRIHDLHPNWSGSAAEKTPTRVEPARRGRGMPLDYRVEGRLGSAHPSDRATPVLDGLTLEHFTGEDVPPDATWGLRTLEAVDEISLVAIPDLVWQSVSVTRRAQPPRCHVLAEGTVRLRPPVTEDPRTPLDSEQQRRGQQALIRHCARMGDRFAVLDAPPGKTVEEVVEWTSGRNGLRSESGRNAALYYPWIQVPDFLGESPVRLVPPSGHVCGMFARVDLNAGVQKPPANEILEQVQGVEQQPDTVALGWLNDESINVIRPYPARGVRVMGGRTLASPELQEWRYVHVRRLVLMIEESLAQAAGWLVFEGNRPEKWREVDRVVRVFLDSIWRRGRLDGNTAADAYQVTCDTTTNTADRVAAGQMTCVVAVRPPLPSEFVFIRLGRRIGEVESMLRLGGNERG